MTRIPASHGESAWERLGAVAGLAAALLLIAIIVFIPTGPAPDASGEEITASFVTHHDAMLAGHILEGVAVMLFLGFASGLRGILRRAEGGAETLSAAMFGGAVAAAALVLVAHAVRASLVLHTARDGDPALVRALFDLSAMVDAFSALPLAVFLAATGALIVRSGAVARWLGWAAGTAALLMVVGSAKTLADVTPLVVGGVLGFLLFVLWLLLTSVMLVWGHRAVRPVARRAPAV